MKHTDFLMKRIHGKSLNFSSKLQQNSDNKKCSFRIMKEHFYLNMIIFIYKKIDFLLLTKNAPETGAFLVMI